jgi:uncharacterized delta-60 repeat protein
MRSTSRVLALTLAVVAFTTLACSASIARAARLDPTFGRNGTVVARHGGSLEKAFAMTEYAGQASALTEDRQGRTLVGGGSGYELLVQRYLPDGTPDASFGAGGSVRLRDLNTSKAPGYVPSPAIEAPRVRDIAVRPDGKILLVTQTNRFSFGGLHASIYEMFIQLNDDGSVDLGFTDPDFDFGELPPGGHRGLSFARPRSLTLIPGGGFFTTGEDRKSVAPFDGLTQSGYVARRNSDGSQFERFGGPSVGAGTKFFTPRGRPYVASVSRLIRLKSGSLVVGGYDRNRFFISKLDSLGRPVKSFGSRATPGRTIASFGGRKQLRTVGGDLAASPLGGFVQVGYADRQINGRGTVVLVRYRPNGRLDRGFGSNGFASVAIFPYVYARTVAVQPNGKILVTAWKGEAFSSKFMLLRFRPNGKLDPTFFGDGKYIADIGTVSTAEKILIDSKGRAVVAGGAAIDGKGSFVIKRFLLGSR